MKAPARGVARSSCTASSSVAQSSAAREHARHAFVPLARAQVVDGLDQSGAIGAEGMAGQGRGSRSRDSRARHPAPHPPGGSGHTDRGRHLRCGRSSACHPPTSGPPRCSRRWSCSRSPRQFHRSASASGMSRPSASPSNSSHTAGSAPCLRRQRVQVGMPAPWAQRFRSRSGPGRRTSAGGPACPAPVDLPARAGDAYMLVWHGDSPGCHADCNFLSSGGWGRMR